MNKIRIEENRLEIIVALIFLFMFGTAGVLVLVSSINYKANCTEYTEGIVIENSRIKSMYSPTVQFNVNGKINIVKSNLATRPKSFNEGDIVSIYYNPNNVKEIWIQGHNSNTLIFLGIALIAVGVSIATVIFCGIRSSTHNP